MKHAIYAPTLKDYADVKRLVELAVETERAGFDGFFIWDVLFMEQGADAADAVVEFLAERFVAEERTAILRREDRVQEDLCERLRHRGSVGGPPG